MLVTYNTRIGREWAEESVQLEIDNWLQKESKKWPNKGRGFDLMWPLSLTM